MSQATQQTMMGEFTAGVVNPADVIADADVRPHHNPLEPSISAEDEKAELKAIDDANPPTLYISDLERAGEKEKYIPQDISSGKQFTVEELAEEYTDGLTIRALVVGTCLGSIVAASNIYLGLKTGFTFAASLFGALLGAAIIKSMQKVLPKRWGGGEFGPRENCTVQTTATAAGGLTGQFVAAVPAMYQLGLLGESPTKDFGRLFTFTLVSAYYGCFFAIPLRKFYILKQHLVFPTPTATAYTIKSLHAKGGEAMAKKKTRALLISFIGAFVFVVVNQYASGILMDWHFGYWLYTWGWESALAIENWGWIIELTPAFFGAGMLAGMNASYSFLGGIILAYGIMGPALIKTGQAKGSVLQVLEGKPVNYITYFSTKVPADLKDASPRYFVLYVGVFMMLCCSFTELACNGPVIYRGFRNAALEFYDVLKRKPVRKFEGEIEDPCKPEEQVPTWAWVSGLIVSIVFTVIVCALQFHMNVGNIILAIFLAFLFSFIGVQSAGATDVNPISAVAKASQLIVGGAIKGQGKTGNPALLENLLAGSIASSAAAHSVDMVGDLKTGHLLRAKPKVQFYAQLIGSLFAVPLAVGLYTLFVKAYPCINDSNIEKCPFSYPSVAAWKAVAVAVVRPTLPITLASGITAIVFGVVSAILIVLKYFYIPSKYHAYIPNMNAVGLGFIVPNSYYPIAMCFGATFSLIWSRRRPEQFDMFAFAISAGLISGEGMAGVMNAILTIAGVSGSVYGSTVGLPPW